MFVKRQATCAMLAVVLFFGQLAFLQHVIDLDAHPAGQSCEICLHSTGFDYLLTGFSLTLDSTFIHDLPCCELASLISVSGSSNFLARAPPAHSLSS